VFINAKVEKPKDLVNQDHVTAEKRCSAHFFTCKTLHFQGAVGFYALCSFSHPELRKKQSVLL